SPEGVSYTGIPCSPLLGIPPDALICDQFGNAPSNVGGFDGGLDTVNDLARDNYGNATGGVRLPYVEVPLAEYNGLDLGEFNPNIGSYGAFQLPPELASHPEWQRILG